MHAALTGHGLWKHVSLSLDSDMVAAHSYCRLHHAVTRQCMNNQLPVVIILCSSWGDRQLTKCTLAGLFQQHDYVAIVCAFSETSEDPVMLLQKHFDC